MSRKERRWQQTLDKKTFENVRPPQSPSVLVEQLPEAHQKQAFFDHVHRNVDINHNLEILFADSKIGQLEFLPLYRSCVESTRTPVPKWKGFRRAQRALNLARYFDYSLSLDGPRIECGVWMGLSSLMLAKIAQSRDQSFDGKGYYIVDSFEGLSDLAEADAIEIKHLSTGEKEPIYSVPAGHFSVPLRYIKEIVMADFPNTSINKGWVPGVLSDLPDANWSFVHIDVDLYEPTRDCLNYFLPRLVPGGVIINDDFGSDLFPGGGSSWKEIMEDKRLSYVVLDTGQAVYISG